RGRKRLSARGRRLVIIGGPVKTNRELEFIGLIIKYEVLLNGYRLLSDDKGKWGVFFLPLSDCDER
ncbi:MAG: hypothetical protein ABSC57_12005, partial [Syntrophales bacterium]